VPRRQVTLAKCMAVVGQQWRSRDVGGAAGLRESAEGLAPGMVRSTVPDSAADLPRLHSRYSFSCGGHPIRAAQRRGRATSSKCTRPVTRPSAALGVRC
jgi:hypothetical protein